MARRFCKRPWGWWLVLLDRKHFKVKLLRFKAGRSLSMQYHNSRHELWLFLSGGGSFYLNDPEANCPYLLDAGDPFYVPLGSLHKYVALMNTTVIEVQWAKYGKKCDESDIVRIKG